MDIQLQKSNLALVFPGQGCQRPYMGLDFCHEFPRAAAIFQEADEALGFALKAICHSENPELHLTPYTQPALLTTEIAMYTVIKEDFHCPAAYFAGHSLGEYTALVASGALTFQAAVKLVHLRGKLMQNAVKDADMGMTAFIAPELDVAYLQKLAHELQLDIANYNSRAQVVVSGPKAALSELSTLALARYPDLRIVPLNVSAPFHSRHMQEIEAEFKNALLASSAAFNLSCVSFVLSNYTGTFHEANLETVITNLTKQISGAVRWQDNMEALSKVTHNIIEVGPGKPLRGFFKELNLDIQTLIDVRSLKRFFSQPSIQGRRVHELSA